MHILNRELLKPICIIVVVDQMVGLGGSQRRNAGKYDTNTKQFWQSHGGKDEQLLKD